MAAPSVRFKTNYAVSSKIEPFYKGGKVQINNDGTYMFCTCGTKVNIIDITTGKVIKSIGQEDQEDITCFSISPDDEILVTSSRALLLKQWDWKESTCTRTWKAIHTSPVASMAFDSTSTLLATGGCDSTIKIWDVIKQYCTHNLKGSSGVVHLVEFHPDISRLQLFSSSMDYKIRLWNLNTSNCMMVLDAHYSAVTSLAFTSDGHTLVSSGRDKICIVWDLKTYRSERTVPVYETVEAVVLLPENEDFTALGVTSKEPHFITAGSKGILRIWEAYSGRCVYSQCVPGKPKKDTEDDADEQSLTHCAIVPATHKLTTVTAEHNILSYDLFTLKLICQFVGYNDEVLDVKFLGPSDTHIVVATNSPQLKVFELATLNCQILSGHTDTILALDVFKKGTKFASCSKDKTIRIWKMSKITGEVNCVAQGLGHAHSIGIISCSRLKEGFIISGSQDCTLKLWNLKKSLEINSEKAAEPEILHADLTEKVHDKDINSVVVSPNDKLVATGSQDRTAKLWSASDFSLIGVFRGHKRGIWSVQFSPMDQILATSSADGTVKLWGLQDFNCLKTFEGHDASVLKTIFVSRGTQLLTSGSDGLLKLWTIKTNECVKTLDAHEDKVWGLHCNKKDDMVVTGATDSCIIIWKDVTEIELAEEQAKQEDQILKQQELSNLLHEKKYLKALGLAVSLDQPQTVLTVIKAILGESNGHERLESTILKLRQDQKESVLKFCIVWNTNSKNCHEAQSVVQILLRNETPEQLLQFNGIKAALEGLIPYTERHFQRVNRLLQASMFLDYMWQSMRLTGKSCESDIQVEDMEMESIFSMDKAAVGAGKVEITPASDWPQGNKKQDDAKSMDTDSENNGNFHQQKHLLPPCEYLKENLEPPSESGSDSEDDRKSDNQPAKTSVRKIKQKAPIVKKKTECLKRS
ncbi:transducin beta-like protein 3 [Stegostoma tigrinum]|uniref:transducin beta-like protein 3 n=1 Tax=Stegostoma tigrinum TaxID=3053191 RepID=UPI00202B0DB5|nr:transducin beta-like protein 3 [Stegostoma tigrinum]